MGAVAKPCKERQKIHAATELESPKPSELSANSNSPRFNIASTPNLLIMKPIPRLPMKQAVGITPKMMPTVLVLAPQVSHA